MKEAKTIKQRKRESIAAHISNAKKETIQRTVSKSALYDASAINDDKVVGNIEEAWQELDEEVKNAINSAKDDLKNKKTNDLTNHQKTYLIQQNARSWGYCIEEKLNPIADNQGWSLQVPLKNSIPDYHKKIDNIDVWADLTTQTEAGMTGKHITEKLRRSEVHTTNNAAADIAYGDPKPETQNIKNYTLEALKAYSIHRFSHPGYKSKNHEEDGDYNEEAEQIGLPKKENFILNWNKEQCNNYIKDVKERILPNLSKEKSHEDEEQEEKMPTHLSRAKRYEITHGELLIPNQNKEKERLNRFERNDLKEVTTTKKRKSRSRSRSKSKNKHKNKNKKLSPSSEREKIYEKRKDSSSRSRSPKK